MAEPLVQIGIRLQPRVYDMLQRLRTAAGHPTQSMIVSDAIRQLYASIEESGEPSADQTPD